MISEPSEPFVPVLKPIEKLCDALAKASSEWPVIPKDSEVIVFGSGTPRKELYRFKYADLTTIITATRPAMSKHGLSFTQGFVKGGFATLLMHSSGQSLESGFIPLEPPRGSDFKAIAGACTYIKRISLTAALGVSADEDVDAAADEAKTGGSTEKTPAKKTQPEPLPSSKDQPDPFKTNCSEADLDEMYSLCIDRQISSKEIDDLLSIGYGCKEQFPKLWIINEVKQFLTNAETTELSLPRYMENVMKRREERDRKIKEQKAQVGLR